MPTVFLLVMCNGPVSTLALVGSGATPQYWQFWLGLALVLLVLFARGGVMGLLGRAWTMVARKDAL